MTENARMQPASVLIVDDEYFARDAIATYLSPAPDLRVIGTAVSGPDAVTFVTKYTVDITLLDVNMPGVDGIAAAKLIRQASPNTVVIMLTSFDDDQLLRRSLAAGATGYLLKNLRAPQLIAALRAARQGLPAMSPETLRALRPQVTPQVDGLPQLTPREREVLDRLIMGLSNAEIAIGLSCSQSTIKMHVHSLMTKFGTRSRLETVARAHDLGLIAMGARPARRSH